jgi:stage IV sporulation protein FB
MQLTGCGLINIPDNEYRVGTLFGFPLRMRTGVFVIIPVLCLFGILSGGDPVKSVERVLSLVVAIILHEFGHAFAARRKGINVFRISFDWWGAFVEHAVAKNRKTDNFIILAGPAANFAAAALAFACLTLIVPAAGFDGDLSNFSPSIWRIEWSLRNFLKLNLLLGTLNLLPIQPLDGGKLFLNFLTSVLNWKTACKVAGYVGIAGVAIGYTIMFASLVSGMPVFVPIDMSDSKRLLAKARGRSNGP